nr:polyprotein [Tolivirales sp.]
MSDSDISDMDMDKSTHWIECETSDQSDGESSTSSDDMWGYVETPEQIEYRRVKILTEAEAVRVLKSKINNREDLYGYDALNSLPKHELKERYDSIVGNFLRSDIIDCLLKHQFYSCSNSSDHFQYCVNPEFFSLIYCGPSRQAVTVDMAPYLHEQYRVEFPDVAQIETVQDMFKLIEISEVNGVVGVVFRNNYHEQAFATAKILAFSQTVRHARNILKSFAAVYKNGLNPAVPYRKLENFRREYEHFCYEGKVLFAIAMIDSNFINLLQNYGQPVQAVKPVIKGGNTEQSSFDTISYLWSIFSCFSILIHFIWIAGLISIPLSTFGAGGTILPTIVGGAIAGKPSSRKSTVPNNKKFNTGHTTDKREPRKPKEKPRIFDSDTDEIRARRVTAAQISRKAVAGVNGSGVQILTFEPFSKPHKHSSDKKPTYLFTNSSGDVVSLSRVNVCGLDALFRIYLECNKVFSKEDYSKLLDEFNLNLVECSRHALKPDSKYRSLIRVCDSINKPRSNGSYEIPALTDEQLESICIAMDLRVGILSPGAFNPGSEHWNPLLPGFEFRTIGEDAVICGVADEERRYFNGLINYQPEVTEIKNGKSQVVSGGHYNMVAGFEFNPTFDLKENVLLRIGSSPLRWLDLIYSFRRTMVRRNKEGVPYDCFVTYFKAVICPDELHKKILYSKINVDPMKYEPAEIIPENLPKTEKMTVGVTYGNKRILVDFADLDKKSFLLTRACTTLKLKGINALVSKEFETITRSTSDRCTNNDAKKEFYLIHEPYKAGLSSKDFSFVFRLFPKNCLPFKMIFENDDYSFECHYGMFFKDGKPTEKFDQLCTKPGFSSSTAKLCGKVWERTIEPSELKDASAIGLIFKEDIKDDVDKLFDLSESDEESISEPEPTVNSQPNSDDTSADLDPEPVTDPLEAKAETRGSLFGDDDSGLFELPVFTNVPKVKHVSAPAVEIPGDSLLNSAPFVVGPKKDPSFTISKVVSYNDLNDPLNTTNTTNDKTTDKDDKSDQDDISDDSSSTTSDLVEKEGFDDDSSSSDEVVPKRKPKPPREPRDVEERDKGMRFEWNVKYPKMQLTVFRETTILEDIFLLFPGAIGTALYQSKVCTNYIQIKNCSKWFKNLRLCLERVKTALIVNEGRNYLAAIRECVVKTKASKLSTYNPYYWQLFTGSSMSLKRQCDEMRLKPIGIAEGDDVLDYARSVNQLHDNLELYVAALVEHVDFDLDNKDEFLIYLNELATRLGNFEFPVVMNSGKIVNKLTNFIQLSTLEQILFLSVLSSGFKVLRSTFVYDHNCVRQLVSPKVITGCKTFKDVDDRVNGNASSVLAKFKTRKNLFMEGVDIFQNSITIAKRLGYVYVERSNKVQCLEEVPKNFEGIEDVIHKYVPKSSYGIISGCSTDTICYNAGGYRTVEDKYMPHPGKVVRNFHFHESLQVRMGWILPRESDRIVRKAVAITNYNVKYNLAPIPDTNDSNNVKEGLMKRIGTAVPEADIQTKTLFPLYVDAFIKKFDLQGSIVDLLVDDVTKLMDWETYKETLRYSPARMRQLQKIRDEVEKIGTFEFNDTEEGRLMNYLWTKVEMHVKWESYHGEKKFVRGIFSRMDEFKVFFGGWAKIMQRIMYKKLNSQVTDKPVRDLPKYLLDKFKIFDLIFGGDFSAFESHSFPWVYHNVTIRISTAMLGIEISKEVVRAHETVSGPQNIENKYQAVNMHGKMMSGELITAIGNALVNQIYLMFICESEGLCKGIGFYYEESGRLRRFMWRGRPNSPDHIDIEIVVSGDDSLFGLTNLEGVDYSKYIDTNYLERYGVKLKLDLKDSVSGSGFLSKLYSEQDLKTICDPLKQLSKGILPMKYASSKVGVKKSLARARAMSLKYEFDGCPIVGAYADCILRCTRNVSIKKALIYSELDDPFKHEKLVEAVKWFESQPRELRYGESSKVGIESRIIVEDSFGISVPAQLAIEEYFQQTDTTEFPCQFDVPLMDLIAPEANQEYYATHISVRDENVDLKYRSIVHLSYQPERPVHDVMWVETDWFDFCNKLTVVCPSA